MTSSARAVVRVVVLLFILEGFSCLPGFLMSDGGIGRREVGLFPAWCRAPQEGDDSCCVIPPRCLGLDVSHVPTTRVPR